MAASLARGAGWGANAMVGVFEDTLKDSSGGAKGLGGAAGRRHGEMLGRLEVQLYRGQIKVFRPAGAGGSPVYDLPTGAPSYRPGNPGLDIRLPPIETFAPPGIDILIRGPALVGPSWAQYLIDRRASGILSDNLGAAGIVRPSDTDDHHIIAHGDKRSNYLRDKFNAWGIDINSAENGVFLPSKPGSAAPGSYHPSLNNDDYHNQIRLDFTGVSSRQEALDVLRHIREQLLSGTHPGSRPRPEK